MSLKRVEVAALVDDLRKSFLYQTPTPLYDGNDVEPRWVRVQIPIGCYSRMMAAIRKAGGWNIPREERIDLLVRTEAAVRNVSTDGAVSYKLDEWSYDDLGHLLAELKEFRLRDDPLIGFQNVIENEMKTRSIQ